jgi:hypothetical protein
MLNCFREEEPPGVTGTRLIVDPSKQVLVQEVEQKEGHKRETIDDRRYDGIPKRNDNQLCHCREESTPVRHTGRVLYLIHGTRGRTKEGVFDTIHNQRHNLKKATGCSGKTLK